MHTKLCIIENLLKEAIDKLNRVKEELEYADRGEDEREYARIVEEGLKDENEDAIDLGGEDEL